MNIVGNRKKKAWKGSLYRMARPEKKGLDFFSHDVTVSAGEDMERVEAVFGLEGYAVYFKLLERIYGEGGKLSLKDPADLARIARKFGIETNRLEEIINFFVKKQLFLKSTWVRHKTLTSSRIKRQMGIVEAKRAKDREKKALKAFGLSPPKTQEKLPKTPQRKVKESKGKNILTGALLISFNCFWNEYPSSYKKSKANAQKIWKKINPDDALVEKIISKIKEASVSTEWAPDKENVRYIPHPATWLNGERWEDEYTPLGQKADDPMKRECTAENPMPKEAYKKGVVYTHPEYSEKKNTKTEDIWLVCDHCNKPLDVVQKGVE